LKVGQTITVASNITLPVGGVDTYGPFDTKARTTVSIYDDQPTANYSQVASYIGGLPSQVNLIPVYTTGSQYTDLRTIEVLPSIDVRVEGNSATTVKNCYYSDAPHRTRDCSWWESVSSPQ
jgi:hypothetical protein